MESSENVNKIFEVDLCVVKTAFKCYICHVTYTYKMRQFMLRKDMCVGIKKNTTTCLNVIKKKNTK